MTERHETLVVNGWIGETAPTGFANTLFAGVFLGRDPVKMLEWVRASRFPVGGRDPFSVQMMHAAGVASELCRCATLTFERYAGPRRGKYAINYEVEPGATGITSLINGIPPDTSWSAQWELALDRLELIRKAELVYTSRLHVALPCLAFGTPVVVGCEQRKSVMQPERFSVLDAIGFRYGEPCLLDVGRYASEYCAFIARALRINLTVHEPVFPEPMPE